MVLTGHQNGIILCWGDKRSVEEASSPWKQHRSVVADRLSGDLSITWDNGEQEDARLSGLSTESAPAEEEAVRLATEPSAKAIPLELCWTLEGHQAAVSWIRIHADSLRMLSSDLDGNIWQWTA